MTTFAPASHDTEHHELATHALAPDAPGVVPATSDVAGYQPQTNGVNGVLPPTTEAHSTTDSLPTDSLPTDSKDQTSTSAEPNVEQPSLESLKADSAAPTATFAAESLPTSAVASSDIGAKPVQPSVEPASPAATSTLLSAEITAPAPSPPKPAVLGASTPAASTPVDSQPTSQPTDTPVVTETVAPATAPSPPRATSTTLDQPTATEQEPSHADAMGTSQDGPSIGAAVSDAPATSEPAQPAQPEDQEMVDAPLPTKTSRDREEDDNTDEPSAKRARTDDVAPASTDAGAASVPAEQPSSATVAQDAGAAASQTASEVAVPAPVSTDAPRANGVAPYKAPDVAPFGDFTEAQKKKLLEGMRNLKKSKHAHAFLKPVDAEALKLPTYYDIVKQPMDLGKIENNLKDDQYKSVNDFVADFDLMVSNAILFNGQAHAVAQAGQILRTVLSSQLSKVPKPGEQVEPSPPKKAPRQSLPAREPPRRAARPSIGTNASPSQAPIAPLDGQPIIRRGSSIGDRPKRKIQKPAPRDLSYAKTPKKKFQAELKFADEVLTEMKRPRYEVFSKPFLEPVDPVALNIPTYFKIIKKPMDVGTITEKMSKHQYENLKEFENDFRQIILNCFKFNPEGTAVHNMGKQFEELFNSEMSKKDERLAVLAPASAAQSPTVDSDEEASEDDDDAEERERMAKIRALNEQVAAIQQQAQELMAGSFGKPAKATGKGKGGKGAGTKRKSTGGAGAASGRVEKKQTKAKAAPKKSKPLTSSQKQEIADRIGELPTEEINRVADQIKASLRRAGKPVPPDDEMEFQIDDIPDDLLHELLVKVRKNAPIPSKEEDDDFAAPAAPRGGSGHKAKKNKPMTKTEQEAQINRLEGQLATFQNGGGDEGMFGDDDRQDEDSSDDDSGSESEEE